MITSSRCAKPGPNLRFLLCAVAVAACSSSPTANGSGNGGTDASTPQSGGSGNGGTPSTGGNHSGGSGGAGNAPDTGPPMGTGGTPATGGTSSVGAGGAKPCIDTSNDPDNCGKCGNACGTVTLASGQFYPGSIAVDGTSVYFATTGANSGEGTVMKVALDGSASPVTLATAQNPGPLAIDAANVYWTNPSDGTVMTVPKGGGTPTTLASQQPGPFNVAVDGTYVYFTTFSTSGCPDDGGPCVPDGAVKKMPKGGGSPVSIASGLDGPGSIAVDATSVYWTSPGINLFYGKVMKVSIGGGAPVTLASHLVDVREIAVDKTSVYWTQGTSGDGGRSPVVMKMPLGGGSAIELASTPFIGQSLAVDATSVYVGGTSIVKVPTGGGSPIVLAQGIQSGDFAIDATNVYWSDYNQVGTIKKLGPKVCESSMCQCPVGQGLCFGACVDSSACR